VLGIDFFPRVYQPDSKIVVLRCREDELLEDVEAAVIAVVEEGQASSRRPATWTRGQPHCYTREKRFICRLIAVMNFPVLPSPRSRIVYGIQPLTYKLRSVHVVELKSKVTEKERT
jgi:hypothetical protein